MSKFHFSILLLLLSINAFPAYAYLDAGAGSMIIQGLVGSVTIAYFFVKNFIGNFFNLFSSKKNKRNSADNNNEKINTLK